MSCKPILDHHHYVRLCTLTNAPNGRPQASAFFLSNKDREEDNALSGNWLEFYEGLERQVAMCLIRNEFKGRKPGGQSTYAVMQLKKIKEAVDAVAREREVTLPAPAIEHTPRKGRPSHASLFSFDNVDVCNKLAARLTDGELEPGKPK